jgi:protein CpxP
MGLGAVLLLSAVLGGALEAQGGPPGERGRAGAPRLTEVQRAQMERRLEERINRVVRERLAPTDEQFAKLREVARRVEQERRTLRNEEMATRFALRRELLAGDKANETAVAELLDRMVQYERRRSELMEREQRELAKFLSPTQRAKYVGVQDELRRTMQDLQRRRMDLDTSGALGLRGGLRRSSKPPSDP